MPGHCLAMQFGTPHPRPLSREGRGEQELYFQPSPLAGEGGAQRRVRGRLEGYFVTVPKTPTASEADGFGAFSMM